MRLDRRNLAALAVAGMMTALPFAAQAAEPYCLVEKTCVGSNDNCTPAEGKLVVTRVSAYRATMQLDDRAPVEGIILDHKVVTTVIGDLDDTKYQLRLSPDGVFNLLIETKNPEAWKGKDQILFRGRCVEGS